MPPDGKNPKETALRQQNRSLGLTLAVLAGALLTGVVALVWLIHYVENSRALF